MRLPFLPFLFCFVKLLRLSLSRNKIYKAQTSEIIAGLNTNRHIFSAIFFLKAYLYHLSSRNKIYKGQN